MVVAEYDKFLWEYALQCLKAEPVTIRKEGVEIISEFSAEALRSGPESLNTFLNWTVQAKIVNYIFSSPVSSEVVSTSKGWLFVMADKTMEHSREPYLTKQTLSFIWDEIHKDLVQGSGVFDLLLAIVSRNNYNDINNYHVNNIWDLTCESHADKWNNSKLNFLKKIYQYVLLQFG